MRAQSRIHRSTALAASGVLALGFVGFGAVPAFAANFEVGTYDELVDAINSANGIFGQDAIIITDDITLEGPLPQITDDLAIVGNNHTIDGDAQTYGGLDFDGADVVVIGNLTITDMAGDGILVAAADLTLTNVRVTGSGRHGLNASDSILRITDSHFDANVRDGAVLTEWAVDSRITDTTFDDNGHYGLYLVSFLGDGTLAMTGGSANGNASIGLRPWIEGGASLEVIGLQANDNGASGIEMDLLEDARALLGAVEVSRNGERGAYIWASDDSSLELDEVTAIDNGLSGFDLSVFDQATLDARWLSAAENTLDGIYLHAEDGATVSVEDSLARENGGAGVRVDVAETLVSFLRVDAIDNVAEGYDIDAEEGGTMEIAESTSSGNLTGVSAELGASMLLMTASTLSGNAVGLDAYLFTLEGTGSGAVVYNSTVSDNGPATQTTPITGIRIDGDEEGTFALAHSTVVGNAGDGAPGVGVTNASANLSHNILWGNGSWDLGVDDPALLITEWNLIGSSDGDPAVDTALSAGSGNLVGVDPLLGPLADNGGPTLTHLPQTGSPAIDAGDPGFSSPISTDQRGQTRVLGPRIDIGAVEVQASGGGDGGDDGLADSGSEGAASLAGGGLMLLALGGALVFARRRAAVRLS